MFIAQGKRNTNIAEYILYMWQVEDLIRAHDFDIDKIEQNLISRYSKPDKAKQEVRNWYVNLLLMMYEEGIRNHGHLSFLKTLINEMNDIHIRLLGDENAKEYHRLYGKAKPHIEAFRHKSGNPDANEIEICMQALYGLLLLRLKKKAVSSDTEKAMSTFSRLISLLVKYFHETEKGKREL